LISLRHFNILNVTPRTTLILNDRLAKSTDLDKNQGKANIGVSVK